MESRRFEVLPGGVGNHLPTSTLKYALERQPVRGGYLGVDSGGCEVRAHQKPDVGTHRRKRYISLNVNVSCLNSVLDPPAPAVLGGLTTACANSGLAPGGVGPECPSLTEYATRGGKAVTRRYCRRHLWKGTRNWT